MLTPLEIYGKTFNKGFRGYETQEVDAFMAALVKDFEELYQENIALKEEREQLSGSLENYRQLESSAQSTMLAVKSAAEGESVAWREDRRQLIIRLERYQKLEKTMQNTLLIAQAAAEEVSAAAERDSERMLREAEEQKTQLLDKAGDDARRMMEEADAGIKIKQQELDDAFAQVEGRLNKIKEQEADCRAKLRSLLESQLNLLNAE